jgi:hypothetical protein
MISKLKACKNKKDLLKILNNISKYEIKKIIIQHDDIFKSILNNFNNDKKFMSSIIKIHPDIFQYASE